MNGASAGNRSKTSSYPSGTREPKALPSNVNCFDDNYSELSTWAYPALIFRIGLTKPHSKNLVYTSRTGGSLNCSKSFLVEARTQVESKRPARYKRPMNFSQFIPCRRAVAGIVAGVALNASAAVDFKVDVAPLLSARCLECHGAEKQKGKLRLDNKADAFKGGKGGVAFKAGDADGGDLVRRVALPKADDDHMPPEGDPLTGPQINLLKKWIAEGANWPDGFALTAPAKADHGALAGPPRPSGPPLPELPKDFKPSGGEAAALSTLAKAGYDIQPLAQNLPWRYANLRLGGSAVTDATIAPLKDVTSLVELNLATTKVTDAGLSVLKSLTYLQNLQLQLTGVTDASMGLISKLPNLVTLNLYGTGVTDAGLEQLTGLKHLRSLYLWQTKVTAGGVKKLQTALPGVYVNTGWETVASAEPAKDKPADATKK